MSSADKLESSGAPGAETLAAAFRLDISGRSNIRVLLLLTLPALVAFEWGAGNDFVNVVSISRTYDAFDGALAVAAAGGAGFAVPFVTQMITGSVAAVALPSLVETGRHLYRKAARSHEQFADLSYGGLPRTDRWILSVVLGTSAAVLLEQSTTDRAGFRRLRGTIVESALYMGFTTAVVSAIIAGLLELGRLQPSIEPLVDPAVSILANPLIWMALFTLIGLVRFAARRNTSSVEP